MKGIGNILWLILGGLVVALIYFLVGVVLFCTIIGIVSWLFLPETRTRDWL